MLRVLRPQFLLRAKTKQFDDGLERPAASRMMSLDRAVHRIAIVGTGVIGPSLSRSLSLLSCDLPHVVWQLARQTLHDERIRRIAIARGVNQRRADVHE